MTLHQLKPAEGVKPYYTLVVRDEKHKVWQIHFGDYDRKVVNDERDDVIYSGYAKYAKIIKTNHTQEAINLAVIELNAPIVEAQTGVQGTMSFDNLSDRELRAHIIDLRERGLMIRATVAAAELDRRVNKG